MVLTKEHVRGVIDVYIRAWETQDPELILSIFIPDAPYHERVLAEPTILGHDGIRAYWKSKVVEEQANISCRLLSLYLDGETAIAEWEASFDDVPGRSRKRIREVAILEFSGGPISSLREYWASESLPLD